MTAAAPARSNYPRGGRKVVHARDERCFERIPWILARVPCAIDMSGNRHYWSGPDAFVLGLAGSPVLGAAFAPMIVVSVRCAFILLRGAR